MLEAALGSRDNVSYNALLILKRAIPADCM